MGKARIDGHLGDKIGHGECSEKDEYKKARKGIIHLQGNA